MSKFMLPAVLMLAMIVPAAGRTLEQDQPLRPGADRTARLALGERVDLSVRIENCPRAAVNPGQALGATFTVTALKRGQAAVDEVAVDIVLRKTPLCPSPVPFAVFSPNFTDGMLLKGGREHITMAATETSQPVRLNGTNLIPLDTPPGEYFLCAVIDAGNQVAEANEANNCACCPITVAGSQPPGQPCGVNLAGLSRKIGKAGDSFDMIGSWGPTQGTKLPCINKGKMNKLEVLSWSPSILKVRIPQGLEPGLYKVGVYCSDPALGTTFSSGWLDFTVVTGPPAGARPADPQSNPPPRG